MKRIIQIVRSHKVMSGILGVVIAGSIYYFGFGGTGETTSYETVTTEKGVIVTTVTGTGQVSSAKELEVKSEASGKVVYVAIDEGDVVAAGKLLVSLDATDAQKNVRDAEISLETAKLNLEEALKPAEGLTLLQAENNVTKAKENVSSTKEDLKSTYEDSFNTIANTYLDLPTMMAGLDDILYDYDLSTGQTNISAYKNLAYRYDSSIAAYQSELDDLYEKVRDDYETAYASYAKSSRYSSETQIEETLAETYTTTKEIADLIKRTNNYIDTVKDVLTQEDINVPPLVDTHLSSLDSYTNLSNSHLSALLSKTNSIKSGKDSIVSSDRDLEEAQQKLTELKEGADSLELRSLQIAVDQKTYDLQDAQETLGDYYVYAPFSGIVATLSVQKGDTVGNSASILSLITDAKAVVIPFNEVDAIAIKKGQKAALTFSALEEVTIVGEVSSVETVGTVSQGVVSYDVTILFDGDDERIKPGMSVEASIVTDQRSDSIVLSTSAVKTSGNTKYVEVLTQGADGTVTIEKRTVGIGISNDTQIEIVSGLSEGESVVTKTTTGTGDTATKTTTGTNSLLPTPGSGGGGGGMR